MHRSRSVRLAALVPFLLTLALTPPAALAQNVTTFASGQPDVRAFAFDGSGTMYVARRTTSNVLVKCVPPSNTMTLVTNQLADPMALVCDVAGNIYAACYDYGGPNGSVIKVTPGGVKSTFAAIENPVSLAIDNADNLYVGRWDRKISKVTPGGVVTTYADLGTVTYLGVNPLNNHVSALVLDPDGTLWAAVSWGAIFKIGPGGSPIVGFNRLILECYGLARGSDGYLYASSYTNHEIWKIAADGTGTLFAGKIHTPGFVDGAALSARFNDPGGMISGPGTLYIADFTNSAIRAIGIGNVSPATQTSWGRLKTLYR